MMILDLIARNFTERNEGMLQSRLCGEEAFRLRKHEITNEKTDHSYRTDPHDDPHHDGVWQ